jgi:hypothetical protein
MCNRIKYDSIIVSSFSIHGVFFAGLIVAQRSTNRWGEGLGLSAVTEASADA